MSPNDHFQSILFRSCYCPELREATIFLWSSLRETLFSWCRALWKKKWALSRGLIFWRPSILMFPGIFSTCLTRTFLTRPRALMITRTISVLRPHIFEISLYFNSFSTILTGYLFSGYSHISQEAFLQLLVLYNDVRHIEFDFCFQCEPAYPRG